MAAEPYVSTKHLHCTNEALAIVQKDLAVHVKPAVLTVLVGCQNRRTLQGRSAVAVWQ